MNRLERLQAILIQLQSKKIVKAQEIAQRFGISERTVYRDIRSLEESGVPIGSEAGVGYWLMDTFNLPPVMFTNEEASSLLIGYEMVRHLVDEPTQKNFDSALTKIRAVLRASGKEHLARLDGKISVSKYSFDAVSPKNLNLDMVKQALAENLCLEMNYRAQYNQSESTRIVEPVGVLYYSMEWHLIAYCRLRKDYRDFRLDRVAGISKTAFLFDPSRRLSLKEYIEKEKTEMSLTRVKIVFHPADLNYVKSVSHWFGNFNQYENSGETVTEFDVIDLPSITRWLLGFDHGVAVIEPLGLQSDIKDRVNKLAERYME
jgi:predicted DNA-binding transcriptional regulator YafY